MTTRPDYNLDHAELLADGIEVHWQDGHRAFFHAIWLRHSPGFPEGQRPAGPNGRFPAGKADITPITAIIGPDNQLLIYWSDERQSIHDTNWLREHEYESDTLKKRRRRVATWTKYNIDSRANFDYAKLANNEAALLELIEELHETGVALLRNVPTETNTVTRVGNWFGHVPANLYSDDSKQPSIGNIRVDPSVTVGTTMSNFLGPHTDTCWRQTLTGLLLMHCLQAHPEGGRSIVVDGFAVAERLRDQNPEAFELLTRIPLNFGSQVDNGDDWRVLGRIISTSADGTIEGIRYNGNSIGQLELPPELIEPVYQALELFESILYDRELWWQPVLQPGDLLILDNHRVLHGREAFDPTLGRRHLQCCSVDRDDFHNRYRHLARKLDAPDWNLRLTSGVI